MKKNKKQYLYPLFISSLITLYPRITIVMLFLILSSAYTKTASNANYIESTRLSDPSTDATENLFRATLENNTELAREAIHKQADINRKSSSGCTALMLAAKKNRTDIIRLLLEHHASVNAQNKYDDTALIEASRHNNIENIHLLLEFNANLNGENIYGDTALIVSLDLNNSDVTKTLILHGADATFTNHKKQTALHSALPAMRTIVTNATKKRKALECQLEEQDWDLETSSPISLLEQYMISHIASLVCAYANPYNDTLEPCLVHAIKQYIHNNRAVSYTSATPTPDICCTLYPHCNCSEDSKIKTNNRCFPCTYQ